MDETAKKADDCCETEEKTAEVGKEPGGFLAGVAYGLLPHAGCIAFLSLSVVGATGAAALLRPLMLNAWFFQALILLSFVLATASAAYYLNKRGLLSSAGVRKKWKYLSILYGTTILVNVLMFTVIFPSAASLSFGSADYAATPSSALAAAAFAPSSAKMVTLSVAIPCSGHVPLIISELKKLNGVDDVKFRSTYFDVYYEPSKIGVDGILSADVFRTYAATVV